MNLKGVTCNIIERSYDVIRVHVLLCEFSPCIVTVGCVMSKAFFCPRVSDNVIICVVVKGGILQFIGYGVTKNHIVVC